MRLTCCDRLVPRHPVGDVLRAARLARGWTQAHVGALAGFSASAISRIERGRALDVQTLRRLAEVYDVEPERLGLATVTGQPDTMDESGDDVLRRQFLTAARLTVPAWVLTRFDDALAALPDPTGPSTATTVAARLVAGRKLFDTGNHTQLVASLPDLLAAAHHLTDTTTDPLPCATVAACYDLATHALNKIGRYQASRITADRAVTYAHLSGSPLASALSTRALSIVLRHEGRPHIAQRVNLEAIGQIEATGLSTPEQRTVFVQMLCSTAYAAAQSGDKDRALELTFEADRALRLLPTHPARPATPTEATALTPAQIQLYKVGVHWALGDSAAALDAARGLRTAQFPTPERRGRLHTDIARAWWQHGRPAQTTAALLAAHRQAPPEVTDRPAIRRIAVDLVNRHPHTAGARELRAILRPRPTGLE